MGMAAESQFHVLAVDDSFVDRKLIERLLQKSSCQVAVTTVDSGSKALEFLGLRQGTQSTNPSVLSTSPVNHQEVEVNLIITDYCMPGMTGYDLLKKVKESSAFKNIPVVIMSSENVPARINREINGKLLPLLWILFMKRCLEEGAEEFFLKPVRLADLNKLKPHMMKTKLKNQKLEEIEETSKVETATIKPETKDSTEIEIEILPMQQDLLLVQQEEQSLSTNMRKSMEEGISTDRARPRFDGITTAI